MKKLLVFFLISLTLIMFGCDSNIVQEDDDMRYKVNYASKMYFTSTHPITIEDIVEKWENVNNLLNSFGESERSYILNPRNASF